MNRERFVNAARAELGPDRFRAGVPLAPFTSFRVGGPAEWFAEPGTERELVAIVRLANEAGVPVTALGGGTNVLIADAGLPGLVIRPRLAAIVEERDRTIVRAEAGATINGLIRWTIGHGLEGLETWAGTPGRVGGAVYGNAHWGGRNIGDLVAYVRVVTPGGEVREWRQDELEFAYDRSRLQRTGEIAIAAAFRVASSDPATLRERARASLAYRKRTQPLAEASAGCVFQNPDPARDRVPVDIPPSAGALVDRAGLKGHVTGGARISTTHANFIVNTGGATAADIRATIELARRTVHERFGVLLRDEVVSLGL